MPISTACRWLRRAARVKLAALALANLLPSPGFAASPLPPETVATIRTTLAACTGGWYVSGELPSRLIGPADLSPRIDLLSGTSSALDTSAGQDLYRIARGLLAPAIGSPSWMLDPSTSLTCPSKPREAVALLEYLVGTGPDDLKGPANALDWLGLAYQTGVAGPADLIKARRFYLRARLHSPFSRNERWSDGRDKDLIAQIDRDGMRPYLLALARRQHAGGAARMILAEEALSTDPARARQLLLSLHEPSLNRLLELERQGRVPFVANAADIAVWAEAWRTLIGFKSYAARLVQAVRTLNGGSIPVAAERPGISRLSSRLDLKADPLTDGTVRPIPVRALVNAEGRAVYVEGCRATPPSVDPSGSVLGVLLDAARVYDLSKMPLLRESGPRPSWTWVHLPSVHFKQNGSGQVKIELVDPPAETCLYSAFPTVAQAEAG